MVERENFELILSGKRKYKSIISISTYRTRWNFDKISIFCSIQSFEFLIKNFNAAKSMLRTDFNTRFVGDNFKMSPALFQWPTSLRWNKKSHQQDGSLANNIFIVMISEMFETFLWFRISEYNIEFNTFLWNRFKKYLWNSVNPRYAAGKTDFYALFDVSSFYFLIHQNKLI